MPITSQKNRTDFIVFATRRVTAELLSIVGSIRPELPRSHLNLLCGRHTVKDSEVAHGICHCRTLHRDKGHRLRRCLSRGLHTPEEEHDYDDGRTTFDDVPQLYIDPVECIDCGACVPVCPVSAIFALDDLPEKWKQYTELNESYVNAGKFTPEEYAKHQVK